MQETFLHHNIGIFNKIIKSKVNATMGTFLDFAYFNSYLQTKELHRNEAKQSFWNQKFYSLLGQFWKVLIKMKPLKILMLVSLTPKN